MNRLSMTLGLALCSAIAGPALAAPPAPAKPVVAFEQREMVHPVLIHKVIDGMMVAGQKLPPEALKAIANLFAQIDKPEKISGDVVYKDRLYRAYPLTPEAEKQLLRLVGHEVKIKVKQVAPGRFVFVSLER